MAAVLSPLAIDVGSRGHGYRGRGFGFLPVRAPTYAVPLAPNGERECPAHAVGSSQPQSEP